MSSAWDQVQGTYDRPTYNIRAAIFNAGQTVFKPFMEITPDEIQKSLEVSVTSAFSFSHKAISSFSNNEIEEPLGKRGTLIFTGATASIRGNTLTSLLAAGKFGARALSQSLAKEYGQRNIHVCVYSSDFTSRANQSRLPM
jgi:short-subunit dehydrogenase